MALPQFLKWGLVGPVPLFGSTAPFTVYTPAPCAFLPQGLCMCSILCLTFVSIPHFTHSPTLTHPVGPGRHFLFLRELVFRLPLQTGFLPSTHTDPYFLPPSSSYTFNSMIVGFISIGPNRMNELPTTQVGLSCPPSTLLVNPIFS